MRLQLWARPRLAILECGFCLFWTWSLAHTGDFWTKRKCPHRSTLQQGAPDTILSLSHGIQYTALEQALV